MRFLAYSDIHHDDYSNGLTLADTIAVENEITQFAILQDIKYIVMAGDWYRATNPPQKVIKAAEKSWVDRSSLTQDITTYVVVGNHDRATKSAVSDHAFTGASIFQRDLSNVVVADSIKHIQIGGIDFLFVPSGHSFAGLQRPTTDKHLVIVLHGMIVGSFLAKGTVVSSGINPADIAVLQPSLVLAGDNHTPQALHEQFGFPGFYLGAPLQHNWGDQDQVRGWWDITIEQGVPLSISFIPSKSPRFVKLKLEAGDNIELLCKVAEELTKKLDGRPGIVEIIVTGPKASTINVESVTAQLNEFGLRRCKISIEHQKSVLEVVPGMLKMNLPEDKWSIYVGKGTEVSRDLDPVILTQLGQWALTEARKTL